MSATMNLAYAVPHLVALCLCGCSSVKATRLNDGSFRLRCKALSECAKRADALCPDQAYSVVSGRSELNVYGGQNGIQTHLTEAELVIQCGPVEQDAQQAPLTHDEQSAGTAPQKPAPRPATTPSEAEKPHLACTPGSTQKCFGAGACEGGQACLPDGSGFGPCDCGAVRAPE